MKTTIDDLMSDGWKEILEFGFDKTAIMYGKGNERLIYNFPKQKIMFKYLTENNLYNCKGVEK